MQNELTDEELSLLNPAERAIMEAGEADEEELLAIEALAGEDDENGDEKKPAVGESAKPAETGEKPEVPAVTQEADDPADLKFAKETPADAEKLRGDLVTRKNEAFAKLMNGEIDPDEYQKVESEVSGELDKLLAASITDNVTNKLSQAQAAKAWETEVASTIKSAAAEGIDYKNDAELQKEFDGLIRVFGGEAQARGMSDAGLKASKWALEQAHMTIKARHPELVKAPAASATATTGAPRGKPDLSVIPPTLSKAPISASSSVAAEFSHMDGLKGADLERAMAKLTPEQADRYLA